MSIFRARPPAKPTLLLDDEMVKITRWDFEPGADTGHHVHGMGYVVVPMTDGTLLLETPQGDRHAELKAGQAYFRQAGVEHNVINASDHEVVFVETEIKS